MAQPDLLTLGWDGQLPSVASGGSWWNLDPFKTPSNYLTFHPSSHTWYAPAPGDATYAKLSSFMNQAGRHGYLRLSDEAQARLIAGACDRAPVKGLTHSFYKYPARFSPQFVRAAIETFTSPGQLVMDPHVGGGTTLVEARALGRDSIGIDISELAEFVATVKTTVYSEAELDGLDRWSECVGSSIDIHGQAICFADYADKGYYKHLDHPSRWRLRKAIEQSIWSAIKLGTPRLEAFGRCAVLRTAQWALDGRSKQANVDEFKLFLEETAKQMVKGARAFRAAVRSSGPHYRDVLVLKRSAAGLEDEPALAGWRTPKLVVTSPPYPGVHVLYHRWQVDGRKETAAPFMIANRLDGAGSSYYTMGDRKHPELKTYFDSVRATMSSVAAIADAHTIIVQMVAFSEPSWQLQRYLDTMEEAGLVEAFLPALRGQRDGRLWRSVPGRRWYSDQRGVTPGSKEVVLIHRKAPGAAARRAVRLPSRPSSEASAEA